jgi:hypothetical protein
MFDIQKDDLDRDEMDTYLVLKLRGAVEQLKKVDAQIKALSEERRKTGQYIKTVLNMMRLELGNTKMLETLEKNGLRESVEQFISPQKVHTEGLRTVRKRRQGKVEPVESAMVLPGGTKIKMLSGNFAGWSGTITTSRAKRGRKGLDVTYFVTVVSPNGEKRRTSVKHGTMNKSWVPEQ